MRCMWVHAPWFMCVEVREQLVIPGVELKSSLAGFMASTIILCHYIDLEVLYLWWIQVLFPVCMSQITNTFSMYDFPFHSLFDVFQWTEVLNFNGVRLIGPVFMGSAFVSYFKEYFLLTLRSQVVFLWSASSWNLYWLSKMCNCGKHSLTPACRCEFMLAFSRFSVPCLEFLHICSYSKGPGAAFSSLLGKMVV